MTMTKPFALADNFLDRVSEEEKAAARLQHKRRTFAAPRDFMTSMMDSLRRVRRKEMRAEVWCDAEGQQQVELVVQGEYLLCPTCLKEMPKASWLDTGVEGLVGPWCPKCVEAEVRSSSHEDGMTYGDSRIYTVEVTDDLFVAIAIFMSRLPDEVTEKVPRDRITALPRDEQHEDLEDEDLVF